MDTWTQANHFLFNIRVGDGYHTSKEDKIFCIKRTKKRIHLSNGIIVHMKQMNNFSYMTSSSVTCGNKRYDRIHQILRDIEGYLIYKIDCS